MKKTGQIVDAIEGDWMKVRNDNPYQAIPVGRGQVNQTYKPYSTRRTPVSQGVINFEVLDKKYKPNP